MSNRGLIERVTEWAEPIAAELGLRLVDVEYNPAGKRSVLRLFLDKKGGVGLEELARASHEIEAVLDANEAVPGEYSLECSSPGVNRRLKGRQDFLDHQGLLVRLRTRDAIDGARNFLGAIQGVTESAVLVAREAEAAAEIPFSNIEKANYEHNFDNDLRDKSAPGA
ncbi:MAG: ribosome maturation factor RimP [Deltaproteobacteria bacterium]